MDDIPVKRGGGNTESRGQHLEFGGHVGVRRRVGVRRPARRRRPGSFQNGHEKAAGVVVMGPDAQASPEIFGKAHITPPGEAPVGSKVWNVRRDDSNLIRPHLPENGIDDGLVLFRREGARRINDSPAGPAARDGAKQDVALNGRQPQAIFQACLANHVWILSGRPLARTGDIGQDAIEQTLWRSEAARISR